MSAIDQSTYCQDADRVVVTVIDRLAIPTGFTPNRDGKNDRWKIIGLGLFPEAKWRIFDRAGQVIAEGGANSAGWDELFRGVPQNAGAYVYLIELNDPQKQVLRGTFVLIR